MPRYAIIMLLMFFSAGVCLAETSSTSPHIGYIYPAGGQCGTTVRVMAGGQFIRGTNSVIVSGQGVTGKVVKTYRPTQNLNAEEAKLLRERIGDVRDKRMTELGMRVPPRPQPKEPEKKPESTPTDPNKPAKQADVVKMPEHPLLEDLDNKSLQELANIMIMVFPDRKKQQQNRQLGEMVLIELTIDPNAEPGERELRLVTPQGVSNPVVFEVGRSREVLELEPNDEGTLVRVPFAANLAKAVPSEVPVTLNGQMMPGDADRFRFKTTRAMHLVIEVHARSLIPYLADAVPGWFQATVALYDKSGKELAFADDYQFNPDPVLCYEIPRAGEYELEIHDAIYRGREDFVYRIMVDERPFITQMFPLGGREGTQTTAAVQGWNLSGGQLALDTTAGGAAIRYASYNDAKGRSDPIPYAVDRLPECMEKESNDTAAKAQDVNLPIIVNGRIGKAGDVDEFRFRGVAGQQVVAEVSARRLNSPLDSLVRLTDEAGDVLAWNDDYVVKDTAYLYRDASGLLTHHADSYLMTKLPHDGTYYVQISDSQQHGGPAYGYRLRISQPQPDFALRVTPSSLNIPLTGVVPLNVYVLRKDGFGGVIEVTLKNAPAGFRISGGTIPAGSDRICMTLSVPRSWAGLPTEIQIEGAAAQGSAKIVHAAVPADDMMQAFLYRHLVPAQRFMAAFGRPGRGVPPAELLNPTPIRIPAGGSAEVRLRLPPRPMLANIELELRDAPKGLSIQNVEVSPGNLTFTLKTEKDAPAVGFSGNVIVDTAKEATGGQGAAQKRQMSPGVLPAIPIQIVQN